MMIGEWCYITIISPILYVYYHLPCSYPESVSSNPMQWLQVLNVASSSAIEREHLEELFSHKVCAVHIESWFPEETSAAYADWVLREGVGPTANWQV